jgi:hypothetical protein
VIIAPACGYLEQNEPRLLYVFRQIELMTAMTAMTDGVVGPSSSRIAQGKELGRWTRFLVTRKRARECRCVRTGICPVVSCSAISCPRRDGIVLLIICVIYSRQGSEGPSDQM